MTFRKFSYLRLSGGGAAARPEVLAHLDEAARESSSGATLGLGEPLEVNSISPRGRGSQSGENGCKVPNLCVGPGYV